MEKKQGIIFLTYFLAIQFISLFWGLHVGKVSRFSIFFEEDNQLEIYKEQEQKSEDASRIYFGKKESLPPLWPIYSEITNPFCITLITNKRPGLDVDYIIRSGAYLLSRLESTIDSTSKSKLKVFITNAERPKSNHDILSIFGSFIDIIHLEDLELEEPKRSNDLPSSYSWIRNEVLDTGLIFDVAQSLDCEYLMALEDDGIVSRNFYLDVLSSLRELEEKTSGEYFALKLFYSDTFSGWSRDISDIILLILSSFSLALALVLLSLVFRISWKFSYIKRKSFLSTVIYLWVFYILLFLAVGKQSIFPKYKGKGLLKLNRHMGSTVGVVYKREYFEMLSKHLKTMGSKMNNVEINEWENQGLKSVDLFIDDFVDEVLNLDTYLMIPNVVQHVGRYSSTSSRNRGRLSILSRSNSFPKGDEVF